MNIICRVLGHRKRTGLWYRSYKGAANWMRASQCLRCNEISYERVRGPKSTPLDINPPKLPKRGKW